jgi:hypothetical protein
MMMNENKCIRGILKHEVPSSPRNQGKDLLEDWPINYSCNVEKQQSLPSDKASKSVSFSEMSSLFLYPPSPTYSKNKSYSKSEVNDFIRNAAMDGLRLRNFLLSYPGSGTEAIKFLLDSGKIKTEDILGIEHLILHKTAKRMSEERRFHSKALLVEQYRLVCVQGVHDPQDKLSASSLARSAIKKKQALTRAALAA